MGTRSIKKFLFGTARDVVGRVLLIALTVATVPSRGQSPPPTIPDVDLNTFYGAPGFHAAPGLTPPMTSASAWVTPTPTPSQVVPPYFTSSGLLGGGILGSPTPAPGRWPTLLPQNGAGNWILPSGASGNTAAAQPPTAEQMRAAQAELERLAELVMEQKERLRERDTERWLLGVLGTGIAGALAIIAKVIADYQRNKRATKSVAEAESRAFARVKTATAGRGPSTSGEMSPKVDDTTRKPDATAQLGDLSNLYSKQIEKYQTQTQARASYSFIAGIVAMAAGLAVISFGAVQLVYASAWQHAAAAGFLTAVGGSVSAYIAKTFLDVHRLSLVQLNHYFSQPVLNSHILTAQRLADQLDDAAAKQRAYDLVIAKVAELITPQPITSTDIFGRPTK